MQCSPIIRHNWFEKSLQNFESSMGVAMFLAIEIVDFVLSFGSWLTADL